MADPGSLHQQTALSTEVPRHVLNGLRVARPELNGLRVLRPKLNGPREASSGSPLMDYCVPANLVIG